MKNPVYAPAERASYAFDEAVRWIRPVDAANFSVQMFRGTFTLETLPEKAVLLAMAANYAEIFINGKAAASLAVRSYIFDKAYEVYDVTSFLQVGKNVVAVQNIDTGEKIRAGFALEIKADDVTVCKSDASFVFKCDESFVNPINYYTIGGGMEDVAADRIIEGVTEIDYDDSAWTHAEEIGEELLHAPYERFHQSITKGQSYDVKYAEEFTALLRADMPSGYELRLAAPKPGINLAMTKLVLTEDSEMMFVCHGGMRQVVIDGKITPLHQNVTVEKGEHFCIFAMTGSPEFFIRTKAALTFVSLVGDEKPLAVYNIPTPRVLYPWNQYRGRGAHDDKADAIIAIPTFDAMPEEVKSALESIAFSAPSSLQYTLHARDLTVPKNGFAGDGVRRTPRLADCENEIVFENYKSLLGENANAVIPAQDGIVNFILDFGTERVGRIAFEIDAPAGTVLEMMDFEMLTDNGITPMNGGNFMRYTCKEGTQEYIARKLRGFRYLSVCVRGNTSDVTIKDIHLIETRYPTEDGDFTCSDARLNTIYQMATRTTQVCMLDLYCDCPGYEQNPWTGDARCTGQVNLFNLGSFEFDEQYLKVIANSIEEGLWRLYRTRNPRYINKLYLPCACFPTYPDGCIPVWSMMWLLQVEDHYRITGDKKCLAELFPYVKETLARCVKMTDDRGLFDMQGAWNLIEWANNDLDFYGEVTANNVMLSYCFKKSAEMAEELGEAELAIDYRARSEAYKTAVNLYCWDAEKRAYVDTARDEYAYNRYLAYMAEREMPTTSYEEYLSNARIGVQSNTMALLYDCVPEERQEDALRFLLDNMESGLYVDGTPANRVHGAPSEAEAPNGYVHIGSPFFMYFALKTLYKFGYDDLALMAQRRDWGAILDSGVKTCYETFRTKTTWPRSAAHAWSASPAIFLKTEVLGIKATKPGYAEFTIEPKCGDLTYAKGSVPTPNGKITVAWTKNADGSLNVLCSAPEGCKRV